MRVGDDQLRAGQAAGAQAAEEAGPERAVLAVADVEPEHLPVPVSGHAGRHDHGLGDDTVIDGGLAVGGIQEHIRGAPARPGTGPGNAATSVSRPAQIRLTSLLPIPVSAPSALTRSSTLRVEVPCRQAYMMTANSD